MRAFTFAGLPSRVVFGAGTLRQLGEEVDRLGLRRVLVLSTPQQADLAEQIALWLGAKAAGVFTDATMHTPISVTQDAMATLLELGADGMIAVGGGSTTGLGKALAYRTNLPQVVVPTTYAGSEMTPILGQTEGGRKTTLRDPKVLPETVVYDVELTLGLPVGMSGTSGMNAIAHAVEALYAQDRNPIIELMAVEGIAAIAGALPRIAADMRDIHARSDALYGAWLCGTCLGQTSMALHHKLCHTLGGMFDLPHAETHTIILPHALRFNSGAVPDAARRVAFALGVEDAPQGLFDLARVTGAPAALRDIGMPEDGIGPAVQEAIASPYWNPRSFNADDVEGVIRRAWAGEIP
jgi:maleylacetate reductase